MTVSSTASPFLVLNISRKASLRLIQFSIALSLAVLFTPASAQDFQTGMDAYERGDFATALREFRPLAQRGNAKAQFNLGVMYDEGDGVPEDHVEAARWYRLAAEQGDASAQYNLGVMYLKGYGVREDLVSAYMWMNLAAAQGNERARNNKQVATEQLTRKQIAKAQRLSRQCLARNYRSC